MEDELLENGAFGLQLGGGLGTIHLQIWDLVSLNNDNVNSNINSRIYMSNDMTNPKNYPFQ